MARWWRVSTVDVDPEVDAEFLKWLEEVHCPELLACPGWLSCTRYVCDDGEEPRYLHMYELSGPEALETPEFLAARGEGPFAGRMQGRSRTFQQLSPVDVEA